MNMPYLITTHRRPMQALAARLTGNATDADDVFQTACEFALRSSTHADQIEKPKSWLYQCVANAARTHRRQSLRLVADGGEAARTLSVGPAQEHAVRRGEIRRHVARMTERRREVFERVAVMGYGKAETAKALGTWPRSVQLHYDNALADIEAGSNRAQKRDRALRVAA